MGVQGYPAKGTPLSKNVGTETARHKKTRNLAAMAYMYLASVSVSHRGIGEGRVLCEYQLSQKVTNIEECRCE